MKLLMETPVSVDGVRRADGADRPDVEHRVEAI